MKIKYRVLSVFLLLALIAGCFCGCQPAVEEPSSSSTQQKEAVDYVSQLQLNMNSFTKKLEVTVKNFVDGDTVHFFADDPTFAGGVMKARFLAINTPESTGKIEQYGKAASNFTKNALKDAVSIIVESDSEKWDVDSTGDRYLVWVWYKTAEMTEYRNLNLEILQNGLAIASNTGNNIYGTICMDALNQARDLKRNVFSGVKDPDFYDGAAVELTLKELRTNLEAYRDVLVAFNCVITSNSSDTIYVEQYDPETDMYYGITVYYGNSGVGGDGLKILNIGNEARIVGKVQYYETGGTWQISGIKYRAMKPDDPENIQLISTGHSAAYKLTEADTFVNGTLDILVTDPETMEETVKTFSYAELAMSTSVELKGLTVKSVYTTDKEESSSNGAMTLTCEVDGVTVYVRTVVLKDLDGNIITGDLYEGKTIDVKGVVDYFDGEYQIKVFTPAQITIN